MRSSMHETGAAVLLGLATLFLFLGYFAHSFVTEAVLNSVYKNDPDLMDKFAGYYGQALQFFVFAVSCVFSPSIVRYFSSKGSLCICAGIFSLFFLGYVHINQYYFYFSQGLVGFGYALFNNAEGAYIAEHSTLETLEKNMALETGIGHGGQLLSGITLWAVSQYYKGDQLEIDYSERHILMMYMVFLLISVMSLFLFLALPARRPKQCIASIDKGRKLGFYLQTRSTLRILLRARLQRFIPASLYQGAFTAFFLAVYPTSFSFDLHLREQFCLVAYYCACIGVGVFIGSVLISFLSKRVHNFGLIHSMWAHVVFMAILIVFILLTTSDKSFIEETEELAPIIQPGYWSVCTIAVLVGLCDCCITTARGIMCQRIVRGRRMESFSMTKFFQALSGCAVFVASPYLTVTTWMCVFTVLLFVGGFSFLYVAYEVQHEEPTGLTPMTSPECSSNSTENTI